MKYTMCRSHVFYLCKMFYSSSVLAGCMAKAKAGHRRFKFMPVITGVAHGKGAKRF